MSEHGPFKKEVTTNIIDVRSYREDNKDVSHQKRAAFFIVIAGPQAGRLYRLESDDVLVGRASEATIHLEDDGISRRHAVIRRTETGHVVLSDLGSTNGTFCNGSQIDSQILQDGDKVMVGSTTILKFSYHDSVEESFLRQQYESVTRDALTNCYNKKIFGERLTHEIAFVRRHNQTLGLLMFDLDYFKRVNDTLGHLAGDLVLKQLAKIVQGEVRLDDLLARCGGEEFAIILRHTSIQSALAVSERIRRRIETTVFDYEGQAIRITISIGVCVTEGRSLESAEELVRHADEALYKAKNGGRNRIEYTIVP